MGAENEKKSMIDIGDVLGAAKRIAGYIRRTPLLHADQCAEPAGDADLWLKLESLQATGSFKARGATNKLLTTPRTALAIGIVTASGGNHGLATARAARIAGVPATVFVPGTVAAEKVDKLRRWGAEVRKSGAVWDEANREALDFAERTGAVYFHPFADPAVVAGQGTLGAEILDELPDVETLIVAIGGGGLVAGIATAVKARRASGPHHRRRAGRLADPPGVAGGGEGRAPPRGDDPGRHDGLRQDRGAGLRDRAAERRGSRPGQG